MIMRYMKGCLLALLYCTIVPPSTPCVSRYISRPFNGYYCQQSNNIVISYTDFQQCIGTCIRNKTCWSLSYNHSGHVCVQGEEPCVTANRSNDFTMVIVKSIPFSHCSEWTPFNATHGSKQGFPKRTIQVPLNFNNRISGVARRVTTTELLSGRSTTHAYVAYMLDSLGNKHVLTDGYDILVVGDNCSTAWVSYTAGDPIPTGAVIAGKDNLTGRYHYVVCQRDTNYMFLTTYAEGADHAYYTRFNQIRSFTDMYVLIVLA